jgi:hypothetical protein
LISFMDLKKSIGIMNQYKYKLNKIPMPYIYTSDRLRRQSVLITASILMASGVLFVFNVSKAASTDVIAATVSAVSLSLSVSDGTIVYGSVALNTATTTAGNGYTQVVTNEGSTMKLNVKSSDGTGGTTWTLGTSPGSDIFKHEVSTTTGSAYMTFPAADTYITASTSIASTLTQNLDFRLTTPTASTDFVQKSITVTVQASTP